MKFSKLEYCVPQPVVIYADFKSTLQPIPQQQPNTTAEGFQFLEANTSSTTRLNTHTAAAWQLLLVSEVNIPDSTRVTYLAARPVHSHSQVCLQQCSCAVPALLEGLGGGLSVWPEEWTRAANDCAYRKQQAAHYACQFCYYCNKALGNDKVHDHSHVTGLYRGADHRNLQAGKGEGSRRGKRVPVVFHDLRGYDGHLIMQVVAEVAGDGRYNLDHMTAVADPAEQYKSIEVGSYRFIDSNQIMPGSLAEHVENLPDVHKVQLKLLVRGDEEVFGVLKQKGLFPYDWFDSLQKLQASDLPPRADWYHMLTGEALSSEDFGKAKRAWEVFGCATSRIIQRSTWLQMYVGWQMPLSSSGL